MEESLALLIVGGVLSFMGIVMNAIPVKFDDDILGTLGALDGDATEKEKTLRNFIAQLRIVIGGLALTFGFIAIYNRDLATADAENLLISMGVGFVLTMGIIVSGIYRGFVDRLIVPPMVIFTVLSAICFYAGLM
ncbi:MAG: hypothetical protein VX308_02730 [Candidatus Thermoplasmatota archaeon]|nr:hypothetical protein [Candidatus Thermoplasmatota archaeon]MEC7349601.1 hypothetical protein [Candidatus Thermoplasmatota archaeon]MEC7697325.1 hypothetical protein [Candidatus Thermoplasmatota archaeon]MEC7977161.1 hypothetical protein [Candidatus Thermoplasmatota archaeon]MEC8073943.1 hypothetical protein [Candidatus Thermoplasmatota archaeon]|tara:strand:+ start:2145 stop:2549 length:405 start_codon:yes stop_codon:yes gene_type:complete